ncbi:MAG: HAD-IIIA family hydrolase [Rhodospirillales bacterium]
MTAPLVILDRDGVLNVDLPDSVTRFSDFQLIPGATGAVARLTAAGYKIAIATNQACVGRGDLSPRILRRIHDHLRQAVAGDGGRIDAIYCCPETAAEANDRRKPGAGMLREALTDFGATAGNVWFVGDSQGDLQAAKTIGCRPALVRTGKGASVLAAGLPDDVSDVAVFDDLTSFVDMVVND